MIITKDNLLFGVTKRVNLPSYYRRDCEVFIMIFIIFIMIVILVLVIIDYDNLLLGVGLCSSKLSTTTNQQTQHIPVPWSDQRGRSAKQL